MTRESSSRFRVRQPLALGAMAGLVILTGCIMIPVNYHAAGSRQNVQAKVQAKLQPGVTTKEDVLLLLGEPDYCADDGQVIGYAWTKVGAVLIVASYGNSSAGSEIGKSYFLEISFDPSNCVSRVELRNELWSGEMR